MKENMEHLSTDMLQRFADDALEGEERKRVQLHLGSCSHCRIAFDFERMLLASLRVPNVDTPSPLFDHNVLSAIRQPDRGARSTRIRWFKYAAAAALILTTLIVVIIAGANGDEQSRSILTPVFERVSSVVSPVLQTLTRQSERITPKLDARETDFFRIFLIAAAALFIIGGLERFIFPSPRHDSKP
jgi:hypothetical protein